MAPIGNRFRELVWANPGRVRVAAAGVVLVAVAAGAFVVVRPDDSSAGRQRHRQYAGATESGGSFDGDEGDAIPGDPAAPGSDPTSATEAPGGGPGTATPAGGSSTTAGGAANGGTDSGGPGSSTSTNSSNGGSSTSHSGATTRPSGPSGGDQSGTPATAKAGANGWNMLPAAPIGPRSGHSAVWTGREMVIWGGADDQGDPLLDGAAYDPGVRSWRKIPTAPLPPRYGDSAYWTGQEMIVFGGIADGELTADGAAWNPTTNTWRAIPASPLGYREGAVVGWAGDRLVVWSGIHVTPSNGDATANAGDDSGPDLRNDGAAYVPATNTWVPVDAAPIPPRSGAQSAWTGSRLIVSGGDNEADGRTDGAALDPVSGTWSPIATRPDPGACGGGMACIGFWTGGTVLFPASGLIYDPAGDGWSRMAGPRPDTPAPGEPVVWAGGRLLAFGMPSGSDDVSDAADAPAVNAAGIYDPVLNQWQALPAGPLSGRSFHTAVWTGDTLLVWGGTATDADAPLSDGAAYNPE